MIVIYALGGLGNQLFQYAAARRLSYINKCPLVVDNSWYIDKKYGVTDRELELFSMKISARLATAEERKEFRFYRSVIRYIIAEFKSYKILEEKSNCINNKLLTAGNNAYLRGYWQSEKYFYDIRNVLLDELTPSINPPERYLNYEKLIQSSESICLHVRRGDYVTLPSASKYHGLCDLSYYNHALGIIEKNIKNIKIFIFSDDQDWVKKNIVYDHDMYYIDNDNKESPIFDLRLMSQCKHHIIANSSFSWWGAWLSKNTNGYKIAPQKWYADNRKTPHLIPNNWIRI